jgi:hypothetical protein
LPEGHRKDDLIVVGCWVGSGVVVHAGMEADAIEILQYTGERESTFEDRATFIL